MFSINIYSYPPELAVVEMTIDGTVLVQVFADDMPDVFGNSGALVFAECNTGQYVLAQAGENGRMYSGGTETSHFSVFLVQTL